MSRYVNRIQIPVDPNTLTKPISDYLIREGFELVDYKGQKVWKKGYGFFTSPQYVVLLYGPNYVQLEAFLRQALLPGVYIGEMGLDGFYGAIPKGMLKSRIQSIEKFIYSLWQQSVQPIAAQ